MSTYDFFTDRSSGPAPRIQEELPEATATALHSLVISKIDTNWFAKLFPVRCEDGRGIVETKRGALWDNARGLIPDLPAYIGGEWKQSDGVLFDLLEYAAQRVSKPIEDDWHSYFKHHELRFDKEAGQKDFREEVNQILHRGGTIFELNHDLQVVRTGSSSVQHVVKNLIPRSGDETLDNYLIQAKELYQSRLVDQRTVALERLWDGFERLKTIDLPATNKKVSAEALLGHISSPQFRTFVEVEMKSLTSFGNDFTIRHHETNKHAVPIEAQDYLFVRMGSLILFLLGESKRLG